MRHEAPCQTHSLTPFLRDDLLTIHWTQAHVHRVFSTSNTGMNMCNLSLRLSGDGVRGSNMIGNQQSITGLFQHRSPHYNMSRVFDCQLLNCGYEKLVKPVRS